MFPMSLRDLSTARERKQGAKIQLRNERTVRMVYRYGNRKQVVLFPQSIDEYIDIGIVK